MIRVSGDLVVSDLESGGYVVAAPWWAEWDGLPEYEARLNDQTGRLSGKRVTIVPGFRFDGGSGPAIDDGGMDGFAVHDLLYRLCRQGKLQPWPQWRALADRMMYLLHRRQGMLWIRAQWLYRAVRIGARKHAMPQLDKERMVRIVDPG